MARMDPRRAVSSLAGLAWRPAAVGLIVAVAAAVGPGLRASSSVRPPRLAYTLSTLPNGLRVILLEDHSAPIVNLQVWYHVGSKNERPGRTGFAHLFEHMMFQGSKNVAPEQHASIISGLGGEANAYTTEDVTVFWETVPSQFLPAALWLEADRMATLRIDKVTFNREREIVKEERRMRIENQPYGRLAEIVYGLAFTVHPYKHTAIGSMTDLEAASVDDVREFYRTYYVPTNATLAIAGDIDSAETVEIVTRYFGRIPKPDHLVPREVPAEPPPRAPRRVTVEEVWPLPVVVVAHHVPSDGHPDSYALQTAAKILSDGQSSRMYRELVYETGIALTASAVGNLTEHPNLFYLSAIVQPGHTPAEAEQALVRQLDQLRAAPAAERELSRVKNQFTRDYVLGRETVQQKASVLARASVLRSNDVSSADAEFDLFQRVTADDVQRVARTYFGPQSRLIVTVLPRPVQGASQ